METKVYVDPVVIYDMTEILTSFCARLYGKRAAENRARNMLAASEGDECS